MPTLKRRTVWKICIPAVIYRVIQEERPDSCEQVALKFVVYLLALIHLSYITLKAAVPIIYLVFSRSYYVRTLFRCDISALFILLCCYYIKLRSVYWRMVIKTVNWKHLKGNYFYLTCLLTHENNQSIPCSGTYSNRAPRYKVQGVTASVTWHLICYYWGQNICCIPRYLAYELTNC
jgi:hypothetical protein